MLLTVSTASGDAKQFRFAEGPIYIGRQENSQVFLPDRSVSRQHAVIYFTAEDQWVLEDLDSANKTFLNGQEIHKTHINTGDVIQVAGFSIEVNLENQINTDLEKIEEEIAENLKKKEVNLEDTIIATSDHLQLIIRRPNAEHAPAIRFPAKRIKDFISATEAVCKATGLDELAQVLIRIAVKQFSCYHVWCSLASQPDTPMTCQAGRKRDGTKVKFDDIKSFGDKINEAVEKKCFFLLPRIPAGQSGHRDIQSVMVAPIVGQAGCLGVIYIDNATNRERYNINDLDYLMFLAIHTAAIIENF